MRIAVVNWTCLKSGGIEGYLSTVIPALVRERHEIAFLYEIDWYGAGPLALPDGVPCWHVSPTAADEVLKKLRLWQPDIIYSHGFLSDWLHFRLCEIAPAVYFAHNYYGTCISGTKTFWFPQITTCNRALGWKCLLHYYPHRCGGWNPVTMMRLYGQQTRQRQSLHGYRMIVTHSQRMLDEYVRNGFTQVRKIPFTVTIQRPAGASLLTRISPMESSWRLLFLGRLEEMKGVQVFLESLPVVRQSIRRRLDVIIAGDGPNRAAWERQGKQLCQKDPGLSIDFPGWVDGERRTTLLANTDLLVFPSLWPEPFGLSGLEAGCYGVPSAGFAVGGVPDWLRDGVNGHLVRGDKRDAGGLAGAITRCLEDPEWHASLRQGALQVASQFQIERHVTALIEVFANVVESRGKD